LVVGGSFQSIDCICFHVYREEVKSELLLKVPPGWYGENTSVCFLMEDVLRPLGGTTILEKRKSPEDFFLLVVELLQVSQMVTYLICDLRKEFFKRVQARFR